MPKFDIPVIIQVDTESIDSARQAVYTLLEDLSGVLPIAPINSDKVKLSIANDEQQIKDGRRIVLLHPDDTHAEFDPVVYARQRKKVPNEEYED